MECVFRVNKRDYVSNYLKIFSGGLQLTNKELKYLEELVFKYITLEEEGLKEPYLSQIVFSRETTSDIRKVLKVTPQGLNNYKSSLKSKRVIIGPEEQLTLNKKIIPQKELNFKFIVE